MLVEYSGSVLAVVDSPPCEVGGVCVFLITRRVLRLRCACVLVLVGLRAEGTAQRIAAPSLFFPGLGVGCAGVGCHAARRVVVAQEDKMITFVCVK